METKAIKIFLDMAQTSSFTKSAQNMNTTQPSVSRAIQMLERELGVKLFSRDKRNVVITKEGKAYAKFFAKCKKEFDAMKEQYR